MHGTVYVLTTRNLQSSGPYFIQIVLLAKRVVLIRHAVADVFAGKDGSGGTFSRRDGEDHLGHVRISALIHRDAQRGQPCRLIGAKRNRTGKVARQGQFRVENFQRCGLAHRRPPKRIDRGDWSWIYVPFGSTVGTQGARGEIVDVRPIDPPVAVADGVAVVVDAQLDVVV